MAEEVKNAAVAAASAEPVDRSFDLAKVIERAKEKGYEFIKGVGINTCSESVFTTDDGKEMRLMNLGLNKPLKRYVVDNNTGKVEHVLIKHVPISSISLNRLVTMNVDMRDLVEYFRKNPTMYHRILMHCEVDLIEQPVVAGIQTESLVTGEKLDVNNTQYWYEPIAVRIADEKGKAMLQAIDNALLLGQIQLQ